MLDDLGTDVTRVRNPSQMKRILGEGHFDRGENERISVL